MGLSNTPKHWLEYRKALIGHYAKRLARHGKTPPCTLATMEETNAHISGLIQSGTPCMVARFGGNEVRTCAEARAISLGAKRTFSRKIRTRMRLQAGFFPATDDALNRFSHEMEACIGNLDVLGWWGSCLQDYYLSKALDSGLLPHDLFMCSIASLEPYYYPEQPWSRMLEGKRVLVVHPFVDSISKSYEHRSEIWKGTDVLPDFELLLLKSVQTISGIEDSRFSSWFEALGYMKDCIERIPFDVAIIGCGAYGFPLASHVKQIGKQAIHLGGATQILFGVLGKRWESNPAVLRYRNEYWRRPSQEETPQSASAVENGCYW